MDWAAKAIDKLYHPEFTHIFLFKGVLVSAHNLKFIAREWGLNITYDYINAKAWV